MKKGETRNPNGRPKGALGAKTILKRFLSLIEKDVKNPVTGEREDMSVAEVMTLSIIAKARKGDLRAYKEILDRLEGTPKQTVDNLNNGGSFDSKIEVIYKNFEDHTK